jgi:hypothetical protein
MVTLYSPSRGCLGVIINFGDDCDIYAPGEEPVIPHRITIIRGHLYFSTVSLAFGCRAWGRAWDFGPIEVILW